MRTIAAAALSSGLLLLACYGSGGSDSGSQQSGGSSVGAAAGSAGRGSSGAGQGSNGGRGGSAGTGNGGGTASDECRSASDCGTSAGSFFECVPPGVTPAQFDACGAPDWCGQCTCGPQPEAPYGTGLTCDDSTPCPTAESTPGFETYASVCGAQAQCTACELDEHCPEQLPRCAASRTGFGTDCFECLESSDCPAVEPYCVPLPSIGSASPGGACRECQVTEDCASGVCLEGACEPGCTNAEDCGSPFLHCGSAQRCEPLPCSATSGCPDHGECVDGGCRRAACSTDADCASGACVNGACYTGPGTCVEQFAYP